MGWLKNPATGDREYLAERSLIGRASNCWVCMPHRSVSKEHAVLYFEEGGWFIKDLGSRNGTWANGTRLEPGVRVSVGQDTALQFGDVSAVVAGTEPPTLCARRESNGECVVADAAVLSLPDEERPLASAYEQTPGMWVVDMDGRTQQLRDGDTLYIGQERYLLHVPTVDTQRQFESTVTTRNQFVLSEITLRLEVSQDGESILTHIQTREQSHQVPARATHQVLLVLAEQRQKDRQAGLADSECGWVYSDDLSKMLSSDPQKVNVDIHRLRQQFAKLGVLDAARIVERRTTSHQARLGIRDLVISQG